MYGRVRPKTVAPFKPDFVKNDKVILSFDGYFRQKVVESNLEQYDLIRKVKIMYFMEDDTITVVEPPYIVRTMDLPNNEVPNTKIKLYSRIAVIRKEESFDVHEL